MEASTQPIHDRLGILATSDLEEFRQFLRRLRKLFPQQAAEACLWYIASKGLDPAARSMAFWLSGDQTYVFILLDPESLPPEVAAKAVAVVKEIDPQFLLKFVKAVSDLSLPPAIMHALALLPAIGDYSILIPWLRRLSLHSDLHVRSRSAKLLCELRPSRGLIERQMQSHDARVRASAIEALWPAHTEDARVLFRAALADTNQRVVGNALVGLYQLGETDALNRMIELSAHKDHLFRSAMAWAMGFVKDPRAIPKLQELTQDVSLVVRKRALSSLLLQESLKADDTPAVDPPVDLPVDPAVDPMEKLQSDPEPSPDNPPDVAFSINMFTFK